MQPYITITHLDLVKSRVFICPHCRKEALHYVSCLLLPVNPRPSRLMAHELVDLEIMINRLATLGWLPAEEDRSHPILMNSCSLCACHTYDYAESFMDQEMGWPSYRIYHIYPASVPAGIQEPNEDMSEECKTIYNEAAQVLPISPRASAALMRLCLQQFFNEQEIKGDNINNQIKELVKRGIPEFIQNYIDACRVIGNNGAHPGELNLSDNAELAAAMFPSMNIIVKYLVSEPREARELFDKLPNGAKDAIAKRDGK